VDKATIIQEGKGTEFWKIICEYLDRRINATRNELETQSSIDMIRILQYDIRVCREVKKIPDIVLKQLAPSQGETNTRRK
jgi:hypothetical protein